MAGYSATPLWKKLGYTAGTRAWAPGAPSDYRKLLLLPRDINITWLKRPETGMALVHVFTTQSADLKKRLATLRHAIAPNGVVWISWPKQSSGVATDITENTIRLHALPLGFVDVKVCAVDEIWSGLKLMIRKSER